MSKCKDILQAIDFRTMNERIVVPCHIAEQTYMTKYLYINNIKEYQEECILYWKHLHSAYHNVSDVGYLTDRFVLSEVDKLLGQFFNGQGGVRVAYENTTSTTFAYTKNAMTEAFIKEYKNREIEAVLRTFIDPFNHDEIKAVITEFIQLTRRKTDDPVTSEQFYHMVEFYVETFKEFALNEEKLYYDRFN